jgi:putative spermidine/putrescine transport system ATP-binding protein
MPDIDGARRTACSTENENPYLALVNVSKSFDVNAVLQEFSLSASKGEFITLLGPSGCGKTTLLRLVAGLLQADSGAIRVNGQELTYLPAHKRNVGMVFQNYALFPHLTVAENIAFGLRAKGYPRAEIEAQVGRALEVVKLSGLGHRSVRALSGGQQQRVSLARAMAVEPTVMLLDEPFSALDRNLRETMRIELRQILRETNATVIFVTHDQEEALVMSDRIAVMNQGRTEQIADPLSIYSTPATPFVLGFVGQALRLSGRVESSANGRSTVATAIGPVRAPYSLTPGARALVGVRPELVELAPSDACCNSAELQLRELVFLGSKTQLLFASAGDDVLMAETPGPPLQGVVPGSRIGVRWPIERTLAYQTEG